MSSPDTTDQQNMSNNATPGTMPPKPAGASWTDDQWAAIAVRGSDLLVAAAAGSGKTAVLVERIIRRIMDDRDPVDVDRLLVATFTKAAAAEMRHRIREALEKELVREPKSTHLRRQLALMGRASITTLHSFCLDVVKRYGQLAGINPGFRIAGETEAELLRQDVLDAMLEEHYASAEPGGLFWQTVDAFSGERTDAGLHGLIQKLYDESRSHPWPEHWLRSMADRFGARPLQEGEAAAFAEVPHDTQLAEAEAAAAIAEFGPKAHSAQPPEPHKRAEGGAAQIPLAPPPLELWQSSLLSDAQLELEGAESLLRQALEGAEAPGGPVPYALTLQDDIAVVERLQEAGRWGWEALAAAFAAVSFGKLKPCKGDGIDKVLQEQVKELRNQAKEQVSRLQEELFGRQSEQFGLELAALAPIVHQLVDLVKQFGQRYSEAKEAKSLVDFGDLEHYCLRILCDPASTPDSLLPSHAAQAYREHFVEVLLDEYQDTNRVQEAIVSLISQSSPGNRFMVGDVKQSIYKFRLAEPGLFLEKYNSFSLSGGEPGRRIDLARNFRSRREVVHAVNYVFKQIMHGTVGEIDYDERAQLVYGAGYAEQDDADLSVELALIDKGGAVLPAESGGEGQGAGLQEDEGAGDSELQEERVELETAQLEARAIAARIRGLLGRDGGKPLQVYDKASKSFRAPTYRDFVILLRATQAWAPILIEELKLCGIPAYAELSTGYFSATEVDVILSLLKIIDNPLQDIPLAAVLRSPIIGLTAEELANVRLAEGGSFYEAVQQYAHADSGGNGELRMRIGGFLDKLGEWRTAARQGALPDLIWRLYRETGYFDFVGGLPGGQQRQANLRALYDRALQYESTSLRGLFRFLRFIERMRDSGADLGTARAIGEQEDVVRIISIHKSKGLEFPVVFVAGMAKLFNRSDINEPFVTHKELGFGPRYVDQELRAGYPTLPALAIQRRMKRELLAEEMRVLYVALTRAREKLILLGTAASADKLLQAWSRQLEHRRQGLPEHELAKARCYLDWVGPALMRHPAAAAWRGRIGWTGVLPPLFADEPSKWTLTIEPASHFRAVITEERAEPDAELEVALHRLEAVPVDSGKGTDAGGELTDTISTALEWTYPFARATQLFSKTTVSEMKRLHERERQASQEHAAYIFEADLGGAADALREPLAGMSAHRTALARRPRFMEERKLTAAERGTAYHAAMQYIPLDEQPTHESVLALLDQMKGLELLTAAQREAIAPEPIVGFFASELGLRLLRSKRVRREVPFTYSLPAKEAYPGGPELKEKESVLIQGVIDCMFEDESGLVLLDFKTDAVQGIAPQKLRERYRVQLELYARAVERIWGRPVTGKFVYYFDEALVVEL